MISTHRKHKPQSDDATSTPKLHLVKGGKKASSGIEANHPIVISDHVVLSHPKEIEPSSSETTKSEKSPAHLKAIEDVNLLRSGLMTATELRMQHLKTYKNWDDMKQRCKGNPQKEKPSIALHPLFEEFADFLEIMGPRPEPTWSVDRIVPTGPYSPDNVRWASKTIQARNRTNTVFLTYKGETLPLVEWAERLGVNPNTLRQRKRSGLTDEEIIEGKRLWDADNHVGPLSSKELAYTPWPEGNELNWEKQYQRDRRPSEHRLHFMLRYARQRLHALQNDIELLFIPDDESHSPRTNAEQTKWDKVLTEEKRWRTILDDAIHKQQRIDEGWRVAFHTVPERIAERLKQAAAKS